MNFLLDTYATLLAPGGGYDSYMQWLFVAWIWTLKLSVAAFTLAFVTGSFVGVIRTWPKLYYLRPLTYAWIEYFRNIPVLVHIFLWYYVFPIFFKPLVHVSPFITATIAIGLYTSPRIAEQIRSVIEAMPRGQLQASTALGMTTSASYRYVILPIAYRSIIPTLTSEVMNTVKNSSIAFAIAIPELTQFSIQAGEDSQHTIEMYVAATLLYILTTTSGNLLMKAIERRFTIKW